MLNVPVLTNFFPDCSHDTVHDSEYGVINPDSCCRIPDVEEEEPSEREGCRYEEGHRRDVWSPVPVNSHLLSRHNAEPMYQSMADLRVAAEDIKRRK